MGYNAIIVFEPRYSAHNLFQSRLRRHMTLLRKTCAQLCAAIRPNSILMSQALLSISRVMGRKKCCGECLITYGRQDHKEHVF